MKFYNKTNDILQVKDAGGAVMVGPFLPGTAEKGPWYDVGALSDQCFEKWTAKGKIGTVE
ncbi:MAG: hypothetical protein ACYDG4_15180 [Desulfuromonadaceae bacterium]